LHRFLSLCLLILIASTGLSAETLRNPQRIPAPTDPVGIHVADLNNDGIPDIYFGTSGITPGSIYIQLGQADGTYRSLAPLVLPVNGYTNCIPADINSDGKLDLVCPSSNALHGAILTFFGNGDGTFQAPVSSSLPDSNGNYYALFVAGQADLNVDGHPDLILYDSLNQINYVLLGDGTGHFTRLPLTRSPGQLLTIIDLNGDGIPDIFSGGLGVLLGKGDGTFTTAAGYGGYSSNCIPKDMDGDGRPDAVCLGNLNDPSSLSIFHLNTDNTFDRNNPIAAVSYGSPRASFAEFLYPIAAADLNGDGIVDILAASYDGLSVIFGKPNLQFSDPVHYDVGSLSYPGAGVSLVADLNSDGHPDIVASGSNGVYISYGNVEGSFNTPPAFESGLTLSYATVADFNGDGILDVATAGDTALKLRLGNGDGTFGPVSSLPNGVADFSTPLSVMNAHIVHGDFNGDGKQDLLAIGSSSIYQYDSYMLLGHGDGTFDTPVLVPNSSISLPMYDGRKVVDLNNDGRDDLISVDSQNIYAALSQSDGSFTSVTSPIPQETNPQNSAVLALADFNHDGKIDAAVGLTNLYILPGNGDGTFSSAGPSITIPQPVPTNPYTALAIATGDFDGDDNPDIAILATSNPGRTVFIYYGNGDGTFSTAVSTHVFNQTQSFYNVMTAADLDGDGRDDLILNGNGTLNGSIGAGADIGIIHALNNRTFGPEVNYVAGTGLSSTIPADFNRDGFPDLLFANGDYNYTSNAFTVLLNLPGPVVTRQLTAQPEASAIGAPFTLTATLTPPSGSSEQQLSGPITFFIDRVEVGTANLTNNTATLPLTSTLSLGTHRLTASWPGDSTYASFIFHGTHTVTRIPVTINLNAQPSPATVDQQVTLTFSFANSVSSPSFPPTGTYAVLDNGTAIGNGNVTATSTSFSINALYSGVGTHTYTVTYSGDANHLSASNTLNEIINPAPTTTTLQSAPNPVPYGQPLTLTALITPSIAAGTPELTASGPSTITFNGLPGGSITLPVNFPTGSPGNTSATITYTPAGKITPGSYHVTAVFSGNINLLGSTSSVLSQIVSPPPSVTTLTVTPAPAYQAHNVTFTANATGIITTPTGTVQFLDGSTVLATAPLASGNATFSTSTLFVGTHTLSTLYNGDPNNAPSTSAPVTQTILPYDFSLSATPANVTLVSGGSTTITLTASSIGSFSEGVSFTIGTLPQYVTATLSSTTLQLTPGNNATSTLSLNTRVIPATVSRNNGGANTHLRTSIALALMLLPLSMLRRKQRISTLLGLAGCFVLLVSATGCGNHPTITPPGTYNIQITAVGTQTPITHTITLPITVTAAK
jgi:Bacterial Ig-like domain (group 3)/FG-GAP-like repeat